MKENKREDSKVETELTPRIKGAMGVTLLFLAVILIAAILASIVQGL